MRQGQRLLRAALAACALVGALAVAPARAPRAKQGAARSSAPVSVRMEDGREVKLYDKSYALVIGVSEYAPGWPKLPGVKKDIEEVARALERQGFLVTVVENPDSAQLDKAFKSFIDEHGLGVENRLLFYFAGHGHTIKQSYGEEMGYVVPTDAPDPGRDPAGFMSKAMDMQQMELYARRIQSKHALFLFDSCFSGAIFALSRAVPASITYKTARPVRQFITSGSADEQVPDQSIFRRQFIEAIEGEADSNRDGYVTGTELGMFLQDKVINYSKNTQHPQYGKLRNPNLDKGDFVFALPAPPRKEVLVIGNTVIDPGKPPAPSASASPADPLAVELAFWDSIKNSTDPEDYKDYLAKYPNGQFATIARRRSQPTPAEDNQPAPSPTQAAKFLPIHVRVRADDTANGWTDSGLVLQKGQRLRITATGRISLGGGRFSTPTGLPNVVDIDKLMRNEPTGELIAVIGDDNDEFIAVGTSKEFSAQRAGRLFFSVNEGNLKDNTGSFYVLVEVEAVMP